MNNRFIEYICASYKFEKKSTIIYIVLNTLMSIFLGIETIMIADLLDNIKSNIGEIKIIALNFACLMILWIAKRIVCYQANKSGAILGRKLNEIIPNRLIEVKSTIPYAVLEKQENQELIKRVEEDGEAQFISYFGNNISLMVSVMEIGWLLIVIATKEVWISAVMVLILVPYVYFSVKNGELSYEAYEDSEEAFRKAEYYQSVITGRKYSEERALFSFGKFFNEKWKSQYKEAMKFENKANWTVFLRTELSNIASTIVIGVLFFALMFMTVNKAVTVGFMISVMRSIITFIDKVAIDLASRVSTYKKGVSYLADLENYLRLEYKLEQSEKLELEKIESVEFRDVCFSYPGSDKQVLNHFSIKLESGKQYAFVGENGAGKSTIIKLLMGIYDSYTGTILINNHDIKEYSNQSLKSMFSYVPQDITKYEISLDEYLQMEDSTKQEEIFQEYKVDYLPETKGNISLGKLEEGAIDLSGGQWQLLSIVRACMNEREMYILDEPTAAIDPMKEAELYYTFQKVMKDRFAILITHRLGAVKMANEIIVITEGYVKEQGTHEQLLRADGVYSNMYRVQKRWYES